MASASVDVRALSGGARAKRAGKTAAILFGLAIVVSPIPPIHWILVPGFLLASIITFFVRLSTASLATGTLACPKCQQTFALEEQPPQWPLEVTCHHCRAGLTLEPTSAPVS